MLLAIFLIIMVWVVPMPLWLSIVGTVVCAFHIILSLTLNK